MRVAIIGGGISGLSTAFYLSQARPDWQIDLFEKEDRLGGTMQTENVNGFLFEAGGNGFLTNKPDSIDLVHAAGADHLLMESNKAAQIRYVFTDGLHRLPESPPAFLKTPLLTPLQKLRVAAELVIPPKKWGDTEETVAQFGYRRLGRGFTDVFLNAMVAGIYASTPEQTSVNAAFPLVVQLEKEYGGLFRGMFKKRKRSAGPGGHLTSFRGGVGTLVAHLETLLDIGIHKGAAVEGIERSGEGYRLAVSSGLHEADVVVVAPPAHAARDILAPLGGGFAQRLDAIGYSPVAVVGLGYDHLDHPLDGFGLLTTSSAGKKILGVLWDSSVFPDRAPQGKKSLRVLIGGQRDPDLPSLDEGKLVDLALEGVAETMGCRAAPDVVYFRRWARGIPNYSVGHLANVHGLFALAEKFPGLYLNSNAYYGISMNDCVANGRKTAEKITAAYGT